MDRRSRKVSKKELELYGPLPTGSRPQLLDDIAGILDEAADKIDDAALHDEKNPLLMKSLKNRERCGQEFPSAVKNIGEVDRLKR
jgi:hypothetical protein